MSSTIDTLHRMADQIARNFQHMGVESAVEATADHINMFWDPRMKDAIFANREGLTPIARAAIDELAAGIEPEHQTRATVFNAVDEVGHVDAG
ncbi:formate dehydrogenase subunit delta [Altericroceibacterium xinjiangense]|uniref:formate dehydrogenase subunit delta n=1 Tax=Altericroceibacterium xinjiangense TaxID=762261 RepID=UPI002407F1A0|nr:formate dehydrogenase subunit delta [Altericroceibacterium xinjiangense]